MNKISSNYDKSYKNYYHQYNISARVILASFTSSTVSVHSSTNLSSNFLCTYNFHSLNIHQCHTLYHITFTLTITRIKINSLSHTPLSINSLFTSAFIFIPTFFIITNISPNLHSHLQVSCHSIYLVSIVFHSRLNTLTIRFFTTSGTQIFAYG